MTNDKGNILVVDDTPDNLRLLAAMLSKKGYTVRKALNGQIAIATVHSVPPDIILLDINMPNMNGYQVCQTLKADEQTKDIPIIFISALDDVIDKVKAFNMGGVDYITKPFQGEEVIARIENQLTICRQKKQLQQEILDKQKAQEALQVYLHAVSHDLRNPVIAMSMIFNHLLKSANELEPKISIPRSTFQQLVNSCDRQLSLINSLVEIQQYDVWGVSLDCRPLNLYDFAQQLAIEWELRLQEHQAILDNQISPDLPKVYADNHQLWRVYENLINNALKYNSPELKIILDAEILEEKTDNQSTSIMIRCTVTDNGIGMTGEVAKGLFERYYRGQHTRHTAGLGLGLYLCRQIIEAHGGKIGVITHPDDGAKFWFTLPVYESKLS
ncbi:response regulator receiver sensor signal transduction histidine kinase [Gloeothece citriformis PCC 7424]|uniref:histidine kinase n=1 Tax=Gloeothece citriformis (strain PCC 7424) TaxID=65393 RepID=B7KGD9_GLOC7|nr:hybrid sensor histidine kinase/response regulator [Gloeothece citriformis]ACK70610.1 response regulator receiver sensor signal transduction histidine kinase [Gloeothece citriformis PCC 7424]